jgi:hypothetical protein
MLIQELFETRGRATPFYRDNRGTWTLDPLSFDIIAPGQLRITVSQFQKVQNATDSQGQYTRMILVINRNDMTWHRESMTRTIIDSDGFPIRTQDLGADADPKPWNSTTMIRQLIDKLVSQRFIERSI